MDGMPRQPVRNRPPPKPKIDLPVAVDEILQRYEAGEMIPVIAKDLGLTERTLYRRLLEHPERWMAAQQAQCLQRHEVAKAKHTEAVESLEALKKQLDEEGITDASERHWRLAHVNAIERACERLLNAARWELERVMRKEYGQKQEVTGNVSPVQINIGISRDSQVSIDGKPIDAAQ
jgi:predicted transcriptional regulator